VKHEPNPSATTDGKIEVVECQKCGAMTFQPSGRCMQGCDGFVTQSPQKQAVCPFDRDDHGFKPEDPCPVCGDLGTFDDREPVSRCIALENKQ
jgi:hypothetical protein